MSVFLTSCVGYSVLSGETTTSDKNAKGTKYAINDKVDILQVHGKPTKIEFKDGKEYWTYKEKLAFRGVFLGLIIPVPLIVPIGFNKTIFEFENEIRSKTTVQHSKNSSEFWCGFIPTGEVIAFGCYSK